jgi:hypothetical protein
MAQTAAQKKAAKARKAADKRQQYGFVDDFLDAYPGIKALVKQAIKDGLTPLAFEARLKNTKWYQSRTEAQRQWDKNAYDDPGENKRLQEKSSIALAAAAARAGVTLSKTDLATLSKRAARNGWTDAEFQAALANRVAIGRNPADATLTGTVGTTYDELRKTAASYGVAASATKLNEQIKAVIAGKASVEDFEDHYRELAKKQFGGVADLLDQGMTTMDVLDPYLQRAAQDLGVTAAQIMAPGADGYMDDMWTKAIQGDKPMTLDEWQRLLRTDVKYGYSRTTKAKTEAASVGARIAEMFGKG